MNQIDLSRLPPPEILEELDFEALLSSYKSELLELYPEAESSLNLESEPLVKLLQAAVYREMVVRAEFNERARQLLLSYSTGANLDHLGVTYYRTERLEGENDRAYRDRLLLSLDSYSTAGSRASYRYHARSANSNILDVTANNAGGGIVRVTVLDRNGNGAPGSAMLQDVESALSDESVRPLNDQVVVQGATITEYSIRASLVTASGPSATVVLDNARAGAQAYADRRRMLGRGITRDAVLASLWVDGVEHVDLLSPTEDIPASEQESVFCTGIEVALNE